MRFWNCIVREAVRQRKGFRSTFWSTMDRLKPEQRSSVMAKVHSKDTLPERIVRKAVWSLGYRYRLHVRSLPGTPDLVFRRIRKAILVHGCFWHGHVDCKYGKLPKSNLAYWSSKISGNLERDRRNRIALRRAGWKTMVVWQCQTKYIDRLIHRLRRFLEEDTV
jgi:DNA mismatch endonuclease, patch repair protein